MKKYIIRNPVPTAEEMGKILGMSKARVERVKKIMSGCATIPCQFIDCPHPATHCWISTYSGRAFVGCQYHLPREKFFRSGVWVKGILSAAGNEKATKKFRKELRDVAG